MNDPTWIATEATVTSCRYQSPGLGTLAWGFSTRQKFRMTFDYYAHGQLYSGTFQSRVAVPQNERITLRYNPLAPAENDRDPAHQSTDAAQTRPPLFAVGIVGSVVLSLAWLLVLRGCQ